MYSLTINASEKKSIKGRSLICLLTKKKEKTNMILLLAENYIFMLCTRMFDVDGFQRK
jgi:hypothetical protein